MGIKIKYREPLRTEFSTSDLIVNVEEGFLYYKDHNNVYKIKGDIIGGDATTNITGAPASTDFPDPITLKNVPGIPTDGSSVQIGKKDNTAQGTLRISTQHGHIDIGQCNSSFCHFYATTMPSGYYFNQQISVNSGIFSSHNSDLHLRCHRNSSKTTLVLKNSSTDPEGEFYGDFIVKAHTGNSVGILKAENDVIAFASDKRLKENIIKIPDPLEKIKQLRGVYYDWKKDVKEKGFHPTRKTNEIGMIAQEVEKVIPQAIEPAPFDNEYKTIKYDRIIPLLVECIKDQQKQIDELKSLI